MTCENPVHVYFNDSSTEFKGSYSQVNMNRIARRTRKAAEDSSQSAAFCTNFCSQCALAIIEYTESERERESFAFLS